MGFHLRFIITKKKKMTEDTHASRNSGPLRTRNTMNIKILDNFCLTQKTESKPKFTQLGLNHRIAVLNQECLVSFKLFKAEYVILCSTHRPSMLAMKLKR